MLYATIKHQLELDFQERHQLAILSELAEEDKFLKSEARTMVLSNDKRVIINSDNVVIGFYIPTNVKFNGVNYSSITGLYLFSAYRGKGTMLKALKSFFRNNKPATVWIDDRNKDSIKLFTQLDFVKDILQIHEGNSGHWYTLEKITT